MVHKSVNGFGFASFFPYDLTIFIENIRKFLSNFFNRVRGFLNPGFKYQYPIIYGFFNTCITNLSFICHGIIPFFICFKNMFY